ncbi:interferon-inducible GTPase 5-like [Mya arenaria]|uniref:interferon-inducible GTPase 5-like n=1 Tax=Mya arenaria TaxID=6604 RepID=UPI0022E69341|nr:interferon-inducible GTPase 5-like [Mya arenaria]
MDSHDGQQHRLSTDNESKDKLADTGARPKENMAQRASHIQDHDELLRERARLQKLVDERRKMAETRRLQKEIEELRRQLDDVDMANIVQPAELKFSPRGADTIQDLRALESLDRKVEGIQSDEVTGRRLESFSEEEDSAVSGGREPHTLHAVGIQSDEVTGRRLESFSEDEDSAVSGGRKQQTFNAVGIQSDEVTGRRLESFSEDEDSAVSGGRKQQTFNAVGTPNWLRGTIPDISIYNRQSMEDVMRYITIYKNEGIKYMQSALQKDLDSWKHMELKVALIGEAGSGMSSLINAILGLTADDNGAAKVGSKETTIEVKKYVLPEHENVVFYDLPGIGTPNFPKDEYLKKIDFDMYDFFLIVSQRRFRENDKWFATKIQEKNLHFYFVRTCIDHDIEDDKKAHPQTHNHQKLIAEIREDIKNNLLKAGLNEEKILIALVNSHNKHEHDFSNLMNELIKNAPDIKREAAIFALFSRSDEIIQTKVLALRQRINRTALVGSFGSLVPIPGIGGAVEIMAIYKETQFYRRQLQIDDKSLEELAKNIGVDLKKLRQNADIKSNILFASTQSLVKFLAIFLASEADESVIKISIPFFGSMISALNSYPVCVKCLEKVLAVCEKEAYALNREVQIWQKNEIQV